MLSEGKTILIGCGVLREEIALLTAKNHWPLEARFLDQSLHLDFEQLEQGLAGQLRKNAGHPIVVCYGACHPLMDTMIAGSNAVRTASQNCIEMLLGPREFAAALEDGAFFLTEGWARRFEELTLRTFGNNITVAREVFRTDRKYLLALRTPCSRDYTREAAAASAFIGLPLQWKDVDLHYLESVLAEALETMESV